MKKTFALVALSVAALALSSCGSSTSPVGGIYTDVTDPITANSTGGSRVGTSTATSYFGLVATGDASIAAAKRNGGITSVSTVDKKRNSILGLISTYTTTVTGN